ncbi:protein kinase C-binding protein 1-like [Contarinia nasturtii]|uniref:protein kinase C-binding protein 1-like n=1 Tax=Contarinia nasturtii TaxID=265458 RepID=UPI0012D4008E|nr:protein kinase C-binding protein 1-like [Contarinia nasturtii]
MAHDKYCWECNIDSAKYNCWNCFRSFHKDCVKDERFRIGRAGWQCPICIDLETSKANFVGKQSVLDLLKYTIADILEKPAFRQLQQKLENFFNKSAEIVNPVDLIKMKKKADEGLYDSLEAFAVDIECILHNIGIRRWLPSPSLSETVNGLVEFCETQIENIEGCSDCYENRHKYPEEWQFLACRKPHIILWTTDLNARKYWPVKLISIVNAEQIKVVRFGSGSSDFVNILANNCYLYSRDSPAYGKYNLERELKEVKSYIENAEKKFGRFWLASKRTRFYQNKLAIRVKATFPDYDGPCPYNLDGIESDFTEMDNYFSDVDIDSSEYYEESIGSATSSSEDEESSEDENSIEDLSANKRYQPSHPFIQWPKEDNNSKMDRSDSSIDGKQDDGSIDSSNKDSVNTTEIDDATSTNLTQDMKRRLSSECQSTTSKEIPANRSTDGNIIDKTDADMDAEIPTKKQRISSENEIIYGVLETVQHDHQYDTSFADDSGFNNSSLTSSSVVESSPGQSKANSTQGIDSQIDEMTSTLKFEAVQKELIFSKKKIAEYEKMNKSLTEKMELLTFKRALENSVTKDTLANLKKKHAIEIANLNKSLKQLIAENQSHEQTKKDLLAQIQVMSHKIANASEEVVASSIKQEKSDEEMRENLDSDQKEEPKNNLKKELAESQESPTKDLVDGKEHVASDIKSPALVPKP